MGINLFLLIWGTISNIALIVFSIWLLKSWYKRCLELNQSWSDLCLKQIQERVLTDEHVKAKYGKVIEELNGE